MLSTLLKEKTQSLHDSAENNIFMQKLQNNTFSEEDYILFLKLYYIAHDVIETQLASFEELDMSFRERKSLLKQDLLYYHISENQIVDQLHCDLEIKLDTLAKAYGALYVLEGSRMGGQYLTKMLYEALGKNTPTKYFLGVGGKTVEYVKQLKDILNARQIDKDECISGAKDTFIFIDYLFSSQKCLNK